MPDGNTLASIVEELETAAAAGRPGDRMPSVRELMRRHGAGPATVQRAVHLLVRRRIVEARPGRGTFVAARAPAAAPPDHAWQTVALGARTPRRGIARAHARPAGAGHARALDRLSAGRAAAAGRARPGAEPGGAAAGRVGRDADGGPRAAAGPARRVARGRAQRRGRHRGQRRPARADRVPARPRAARGRGDPRVADVPRRGGRRACGAPRPGPRAERRARHPPGAARRGAGELGRAARLLPADVREPARRGAGPGAPCRRARRRARRGRVPDRGRSDARPGVRPASGSRRRSPTTTRTATSSTSRR